MNVTGLKQTGVKIAKLHFCSISIYRNLMNDGVIHRFYTLLDYIDSDSFSLDRALFLYNDFFFSLAKSSSCCSLKNYILERLIYDENPFSLAVEQGAASEHLKSAVFSDLNHLQAVSSVSSSLIKEHIVQKLMLSGFEAKLAENLPQWDAGSIRKNAKNILPYSGEWIEEQFLSANSWQDNQNILTNFHSRCGCGDFARFRGFVWENVDGKGCLKGVESPDPIKLSDLIGYELERSEVITNTQQFLKGLPANNMLLYGDRGTGKSSTVKAILNEYCDTGLRVIELPKKCLIDFPKIIELVKGRKYKFILFVDDLAFEDNEENYTALKAALEGGLLSRPDNVLIYATSNRRHLIKEKFSDRAGLSSANHDDEVRAADSIQEKLSLSDRFGMTVVFSSPDKRKYLEIVEGLALKRGLSFDKEQLHREALKWEMWYNGRSPRTARQFVDWFEGLIKNKLP